MTVASTSRSLCKGEPGSPNRPSANLNRVAAILASLLDRAELSEIPGSNANAIELRVSLHTLHAFELAEWRKALGGKGCRTTAKKLWVLASQVDGFHV